MITNLYTIYDSKAKIYNKPFYLLNDQVAIRTATDLLRDETCDLFNHPEDFTLFRIGNYDDSNAEITLLSPMKSIIRFHEIFTLLDMEQTS